MAKLFNRFGKLQRTSKMNNDGIGLGLTIVQQIVEAAKGNVSVNSQGIGQGSIFSFTMLMHPVDDDLGQSQSIQMFGEENKSEKSLDIEDSNQFSKNSVQDMRLDISQLELTARAEEDQNFLTDDKYKRSKPFRNE